MIVIVHQDRNQATLTGAVNLSVAPSQGLVIEFKTVKQAVDALLALKKNRISTKIVNNLILNPDSTGFTAFEESQK